MLREVAAPVFSLWGATRPLLLLAALFWVTLVLRIYEFPALWLPDMGRIHCREAVWVAVLTWSSVLLGNAGHEGSKLAMIIASVPIAWLAWEAVQGQNQQILFLGVGQLGAPAILYVLVMFSGTDRKLGQGLVMFGSLAVLVFLLVLFQKMEGISLLGFWIAALLLGSMLRRPPDDVPNPTILRAVLGGMLFNIATLLPVEAWTRQTDAPAIRLGVHLLLGGTFIFWSLLRHSRRPLGGLWLLLAFGLGALSATAFTYLLLGELRPLLGAAVLCVLASSLVLFTLQSFVCRRWFESHATLAQLLWDAALACGSLALFFQLGKL
jgi:hypothetical protein